MDHARTRPMNVSHEQVCHVLMPYKSTTLYLYLPQKHRLSVIITDMGSFYGNALRFSVVLEGRLLSIASQG